MSNIIFRGLLETDINYLYSQPDATNWLIPFYKDRKLNFEHKRENIFVAIEQNTQNMLFMFPEDFSLNDKGDWYIYCQSNNGLFITQLRDELEFKILYLSTSLIYLQEHIQNKILEILFLGGMDLSGQPDKCWLIPEVNIEDFTFTKAENNDKGRF